MESRKKRLFSREQVRGCILGGAVGDALGYPVEFLSYEQIRMKYGSRGITGYDLDENGLAEISDDTQMTLFTATGLLFASTRAHTHGVCGYPDYYARMHYIDWLATQTGGHQGGYGGSWLGWEKRMYVRRAPGNTCMDALEIIRRGGTVENGSKGCGGVMRVAPAAVFNDYCENSEGQIATLAAKLAGITHKHPLGSLPAAALAMIIRRIVLEKCPANFNCLAGLVQKVATDVLHTRIDFENSSTYYEEWPQESEKLTALLRRTVQTALEPISDQEAIQSLGEGWTADEALAIALLCVLRHPDSFEDAVIAAVNHDGDSDSTGAICGNIMGVIVGEKGIPSRFLERLEIKDLIDEVSEDFYIGCRIAEYGPLEEISREDARNWEIKYIYSSSLHREISWDSEEFKKEFAYEMNRFRQTHSEKSYNKIRQLRVRVFNNTMKIVNERQYWSPVMMPEKLYYYDDMPKVEFFSEEITLPKKSVSGKEKTKFFVVNEDCLDLAQRLHDKRPAVLNMASRRQPGGGVLSGSGAQEESIFRRTDIFKYLYQFSDTGMQYGIEQRPERYPLDRNYGGIYTPGIKVFRKGEKDGYELTYSYNVDIISVAGMNRPELKDNEHVADYLVEPIKNKMRTILRIALLHNHTCLVLGALGCGAFRNPPRHVARMFHEVFNESEFKGRFSEVYFAILEDHNSHKAHNPQGNLKPFMEEFAGA